MATTPGAAEAVAFLRAWIAADHDTAGAILDQVHGDNHATAELLCNVAEIARHAAGGDLTAVLDNVQAELVDR